MIAPNTPEGSLRRYFDVDYVSCRDLAKRTIEHYHFTIKALEKWCGHVVMLDDLTDDLVNGFLMDQQERGLSPKTIDSSRTDVMALWRQAVQDCKIDALPRRVRRIKVHRKTITAWTLDEMTALVRAAESIESYSTFGTVMIHRGKLLKAYILVGWDTGLRRGDMLRLKRSDIQDDGRIDLTQANTEQLHACRVRPETIAAVDESFLNLPPRERIFAVKKDWLNRWFRILVGKAFHTHDGAKTHKLRHSSGSHVEAIMPGCGAKHLGHAPRDVFGITRAEPTLPPPIPGYQTEANGKNSEQPAATPPALPPPLPGQR